MVTFNIHGNRGSNWREFTKCQSACSEFDCVKFKQFFVFLGRFIQTAGHNDCSSCFFASEVSVSLTELRI